MLYIVPVQSESGDSYLFGPFSSVPTHDEVVAVFRKHSPDEADYCEELGYSYMAYPLPEAPGTLDFQSDQGVECLRS